MDIHTKVFLFLSNDSFLRKNLYVQFLEDFEQEQGHSDNAVLSSHQ